MLQINAIDSDMNKYEQELKAIIARLMKKPRNRERAFQRLRKKLNESARSFEQAAEKKENLYRDALNEVVGREIAFLRATAAEERARIKELDLLNASDWPP